MIRLSIATVVGSVIAGIVAWRLGGALGGGVIAGFLLGGGLSGLGVMFQRHVLLTQPEKAMTALVVSFLFKLVGLLMGAIAFRYIEAAALRADWRSFLVAFAAAVIVILPLGAWDAAQVARRRTESVNPGL